MKPFIRPDPIDTTVTKEAVIDHLAYAMAHYQKKADEHYYIRGDVDHSAWLCDLFNGVVQVALNMGVTEEAYERAYEYYDFRNSGRPGYTLKDGKIVKEEEDGERMSRL